MLLNEKQYFEISIVFCLYRKKKDIIKQKY